MEQDEHWTDEFLSMDRRKQILTEELEKVLQRPARGKDGKPDARESHAGRATGGSPAGERPDAE